MTKLMLIGGISGFHTSGGNSKRLYAENKGKSFPLNILTFPLISITLSTRNLTELVTMAAHKRSFFS
jgi:hypothetical protein